MKTKLGVGKGVGYGVTMTLCIANEILANEI